MRFLQEERGYARQTTEDAREAFTALERLPGGAELAAAHREAIEALERSAGRVGEDGGPTLAEVVQPARRLALTLRDAAEALRGPAAMG